MNQLFPSASQSTGASAPVSVLGRTFFKIDWFDLLAVQGTVNSLLQPHNSKESFFSALSLLYSPTLTSIRDYWKNHSFTIQTFVGKVMFLLFNMLSRFAIVFAQVSMQQVSLSFMAAVTVCSDFGAQENKICYCIHFSPFYLP